MAILHSKTTFSYVINTFIYKEKSNNFWKRIQSANDTLSLKMVYLKSKITVWNDSHLLPVNILRDKTVFLQHAVILKYHIHSHSRPNTHSYIRKWLGDIFLDSEENVFKWCNHMFTRLSGFQLWRHAQDIKGLKARVLLKNKKHDPLAVSSLHVLIFLQATW